MKEAVSTLLMPFPRPMGRASPENARNVLCESVRGQGSRVTKVLVPADSLLHPEMVEQGRLPLGAGPGCESSPVPVGPGLADPPDTGRALPEGAGTRARTSSRILGHPHVATVTVCGSLRLVIKHL